ncbi:TrpB-like pyridoxal phosphate-dependent enzyme [Paenibacillus polymyxa]|uniref:TrpB-like pyridoxal phosphate-dependent enzyme n=1 Tax=Paenibacillus polymyxa TaxID=1406 RepID=UPI001BEC85B7|nr:TrpB-like pyridoxal phosphate-dependent enzyme [Paenibacillus polymyxa]MBT2284121.1 TrpB-like pyridoxal phosphate-dependent enzyme [Paenibacillus polymyxa]
MISKWLNVRSLLSTEQLSNIYKYEQIDNYRDFHPNEVINHALSKERWIDIPQQLLENYQMIGRQTPLKRAFRLEKAFGTNNKIYIKREDTLSNGSFKITSALPQAYYGSIEGKSSVITETGAGQTGVAAALAAKLTGMDCKVYMVRNSYDLKKLRRLMMEMYGAKVIASPSEYTNIGRDLIEKGEKYGSIALATSEVMEEISQTNGSMNIAGSLFDFVLTYNTLIGLEVIEQLINNNIEPDIVIGCVGGGSSFGGFALPLLDYYGDRLERVVCTESSAIPTLTEGSYIYDYADGNGGGNKLLMYSLGCDFKAPGLHASGLRYHAASPILSHFVHEGTIEAQAYDETEAMKSAIEFAREEGVVASPESSYTLHAIKEMCKEYDNKNIVALLTGNGQLDLESYGGFL